MSRLETILQRVVPDRMPSVMSQCIATSRQGKQKTFCWSSWTATFVRGHIGKARAMFLGIELDRTLGTGPEQSRQCGENLAGNDFLCLIRMAKFEFYLALSQSLFTDDQVKRSAD
ncbi:MAG: hypothetical protein K0S45_1572 [Nitrospira sp.]|nr:hypothetical protein [Nitrospira sp.]